MKESNNTEATTISTPKNIAEQQGVLLIIGCRWTEIR
jgi:hypothetical protein